MRLCKGDQVGLTDELGKQHGVLRWCGQRRAERQGSRVREDKGAGRSGPATDSHLMEAGQELGHANARVEQGQI